jgi:glycosyltransferase involved in cell wall biosynthesis
MKIAYDYQAFALTPYGGGSRYLYESSKIISQMPDCEVTIVAPLHNNQYLKDSPPGVVVGKTFDNLQDLLGLTTLINRKGSEYWLRQNPPDILHETYYSNYDIAPPNCKTVLTVYDMIHEKFGDGMNASERDVISRKQKAIERADLIVCISESTRKDLLEITNVDPNKAVVVYLGCSLTKLNNPDESPLVTTPYLLYVGARGHYKNFKTFLQAYATHGTINSEFKIVCFGGGNFAPAEKAEMRQHNISEDQIQYFEGDDQLLANLYTHAAAFVYTSLYEGFGIPPIEAMYLGCPVIAGNGGSIAEVVGDAGYPYDPLDSDSLGAAIEAVVFSPENRKRLIQQGLQQATLFSWQRCAQETYQAYLGLV